MSIALPKIEQATKPVGVGGLSRDDLDLYTVPGTEIQFSDVGGDAVTWLWTLVDQPPGATATLATPNAQSTSLLGVSVAGSYLVQLEVDGGLVPGSVRRVVAGVQLDTPAWVLPPLNRPLRIPARGETFEFNVESSPGTGANSRGWAQEMDHWFRTLLAYAFGVKATNDGTPVDPSTAPFYTLNFVGGGVTDGGNGVLDITAAFTPANDLSNAPAAQTVVGIQSTPVDATAPTDLQVLVFQGATAKYVPTSLTMDMISPAFVVTSFSTTPMVEVGFPLATPLFSAAYSLPLPLTSAYLTDSEASPTKDVTATPTVFSSDGTWTKNTYGQRVDFSLTATRGGVTNTSTISTYWRRRVYWGGAAKPGAYTEAFVKGLSGSALASSKNTTFSADGGIPASTTHIYYAYRAAYPLSRFWVGGFEGGFSLVATIPVGTSAGPGVLAENYYVYESDQAGLGVTTVLVTD